MLTIETNIMSVLGFEKNSELNDWLEARSEYFILFVPDGSNGDPFMVPTACQYTYWFFTEGERYFEACKDID